MDNMELITSRLMAGWNGMVMGGLLTRDELYDSLHAQESGEMDMSADELDDDMAELMGWNPSDITEDQYRMWKHIVDMAAGEYIRQ